MNSLLGLVSRIQFFSTGDGPGIRTTIFLQGCNLRCKWCHNPETIPREPVLLFYEKLCASCGNCVKACPRSAHQIHGDKHQFLRNQCTGCGLCASACTADALHISGGPMFLETVQQQILRDSAFYHASGGGVTISGGEPLLQPAFTAGIAKFCCENGISVILDTAGNVPYESLASVAPYLTAIYFDLKGGDWEAAKAATGCNLHLVRGNLKKLRAQNNPVQVRIPIIPGYNADEATIKSIIDILQECGYPPVDLLPFHSLGKGKYEALHRRNLCEDTAPPSQKLMDDILDMFLREGISAKIEN